MLNDQESAFVLPVDFCCTIVTNQTLLSNIYSVKLAISPHEDSGDNIGLGFQKIKAIVENSLNNGILISSDNELLPVLSSLENPLVVLPSEPYDFYVGTVLLAKFIRVTEKYFDIDCLGISSVLGHQIQYNVFDTEDCGLDLNGDAWWNTDDMSVDSAKPISWDDVQLTEAQPFTPLVVKGGLSES